MITSIWKDGVPHEVMDTNEKRDRKMAKSTGSRGSAKDSSSRGAGKAGWPAKTPKGRSPLPGKSGRYPDNAPPKGKSK